MSYSKWIKMDLHIHSHESKRTKSNDYNGEDLTYDKLIYALEKENVNMFSITDHNTINEELYKELLQRRDQLYEKNMNFVIGSEIDFFDEEIHDKTFHMLTFFDTDNIDKVAQLLAKVFCKDKNEDIDTTVSPIDLKSFFKEAFSVGIKNIITIPHFNQKDKGIPAADIDKFVYTVFNALEDSNNRNRLVKSIKLFKDYKYTDVPVVVFSDNHNIDIYPCGKNKNKDKLTSMCILGNIRFPFNSIKAALSKPIFMTLATATFLWNWNSYIWPLLVSQSQDTWVLQIAIAYLKGQYVTEWNKVLAASCLASFPPIILFSIFQKYLVDGIKMGGVKG